MKKEKNKEEAEENYTAIGMSLGRCLGMAIDSNIKKR